MCLRCVSLFFCSSLPVDAAQLSTAVPKDPPTDFSVFDALRDTIYSEVATLIANNEARPHFLVSPQNMDCFVVIYTYVVACNCTAVVHKSLNVSAHVTSPMSVGLVMYAYSGKYLIGTCWDWRMFG